MVQEDNNHKNLTPPNDISILFNVAQRPDFKNKGNFNNYKNHPCVCAFCHGNGHTINFCYQKHGHPNFNKNKYFVNASHVDTSPQQLEETQVASSARNNASISQAKYDQLLTYSNIQF